MFSILLVLTVSATFIQLCVNGQALCQLHNGGNGTCLSINQCPSLLKIFKRVVKSQEDLDLLMKSQLGCSFEGTIPMVCCPASCYTPDRQEGTCVNIYSCPSLVNLLQRPLLKQSLEYIQGFKCNNLEENSVCCPPVDTNPGAKICAATVSALPPDPRSECCGVDRGGNKIIVGAQTTIEQYPWMAIIDYVLRGKLKFLCVGSLISGRYVLTAGHCVTGGVLMLGKPDRVRLGEYNTKNEGPDCVSNKSGATNCTDGVTSIGIERTIPHPDYNSSDIALLRLMQIAPFTDFIRPICLPDIDVTVASFDNLILYAAGWGAPSPNRSVSDVKLHVDLPFVNKDQCQSIYESLQNKKWKITAGHFCAGGIPGKDACKGDSGAPLMFKNGNSYEVVGIVSYRYRDCGAANIPGIYINVYKYLSWIRSTINIEETLGIN